MPDTHLGIRPLQPWYGWRLRQSWGFAGDVAVTRCLGQIPLKIPVLAVLGVPWGYTAHPP